MSNLKIIYRNIFDNYDTLAMGSGNIASGFPLTNLVNDSKAKTWRSTNLSSQVIKATWTTPKSLSGVALAFTNLISGSTFSIRLYNDTVLGQILYDSSTIPVTFNYDPPIGFATINSSSFAYGGGCNVSVFTDTLISGIRRMEIELSSPGNPDGFIEISRIIAGIAWEPNDNADYGATTGFIDTTSGVRLSSGDLLTNRGTISRVMEFSLKAMDSEDKSALNNLFRSVGKSQPLFISLIPARQQKEEQLSQQIYGKLDQDISIGFPFFQRYDSTVRITEI